MVETVVDAVSRMYFKRSDFRTKEELFEEIHKQVDILMSHLYAVSVYQSLLNCNIYILEYAPMDNEITSLFMLPVFLTAPEAKVIEELRKGNNPLEKKKIQNTKFKGGNNNFEA